MSRQIKTLVLFLTLFVVLGSITCVHAQNNVHAQNYVNTLNPTVLAPVTNFDIPNVDIKIGSEKANLSSALQVVIVLTILALLPAIILMMTPFTRIIIIFSFIRRALGLQTTPPNQVIIGLSLFMTLYLMSPIFQNIYVNSYEPFVNGEITQNEAYDRAITPMREYMFKNVRQDDLALFVKLESGQKVTKLENVSTTALIPAFVISELKTAFVIGFKLFIPFLVIDMVVASTLMALGMMMLPPVMISLPFKILLFVLVDGWNLLTNAILAGISI